MDYSPVRNATDKRPRLKGPVALVKGPVALASELHQTRLRAHRLRLEFIQTELQLANAFLDLAETTSNAAACSRNMQNTAKALDAVGRFVETLSPELLVQRQELGRHAAQVRTRLLNVRSRLQASGGSEDPDRHPSP